MLQILCAGDDYQSYRIHLWGGVTMNIIFYKCTQSSIPLMTIYEII